MGIFRKKIAKVYDVGPGDPVLAEQEVSKNVDVNGVSTTMVVVEKSDLSHIPMPTKDEYDLEEQLKAGFSPKEINVRGILPNADGVVSALDAFNSLQDQIDKLSSPTVEEKKD